MGCCQTHLTQIDDLLNTRSTSEIQSILSNKPKLEEFTEEFIFDYYAGSKGYLTQTDFLNICQFLKLDYEVAELRQIQMRLDCDKAGKVAWEDCKEKMLIFVEHQLNDQLRNRSGRFDQSNITRDENSDNDKVVIGSASGRYKVK